MLCVNYEYFAAIGIDISWKIDMVILQYYLLQIYITHKASANHLDMLCIL